MHTHSGPGCQGLDEMFLVEELSLVESTSALGPHSPVVRSEHIALLSAYDSLLQSTRAGSISEAAAPQQERLFTELGPRSPVLAPAVQASSSLKRSHSIRERQV